MSQSGSLYVVATPIGNLGDFSERAIETLKSVSCVAVEDTRHSGRLFKQFGISTPMCRSLHEHNEKHRSVTLISKLSGWRRRSANQ